MARPVGSKAHRDRAYREKAPEQVSWYQPELTLSLGLIQRAVPDTASAIIDVGGGASTLVDGLLAAARTRLGAAAVSVIWLEADVLTTLLRRKTFDLWHDRAVFHFPTEPSDRRSYIAQVLHAVRAGGHVLIATFAPDAPPRCSGLDVARYSPEALQAELGAGFLLQSSHREEHRTPDGRAQMFSYCLFRIGGSAAPGG
jgi:hypothetical protein